MADETPLNPNELVLRQALLSDLDKLIYISRECFLDHLRWRSYMPVGKRWWRAVLESNGNRTWIAEDDGRIWAFFTVVFDLDAWRASAKKRMGGTAVRLASALCCPVPAVWARSLRNSFLGFFNKKVIRYNQVTFKSGRTAWAELMGILPSMRNKGFGSRLLREVEQKSLAEGAAFMEGHIDTRNTSSRKVFEKNGFVLIFESVRGCNYKKRLLSE